MRFLIDKMIRKPLLLVVLSVFSSIVVGEQLQPSPHLIVHDIKESSHRVAANALAELTIKYAVVRGKRMAALVGRHDAAATTLLADTMEGTTGNSIEEVYVWRLGGSAQVIGVVDNIWWGGSGWSNDYWLRLFVLPRDDYPSKLGDLYIGQEGPNYNSRNEFKLIQHNGGPELVIYFDEPTKIAKPYVCAPPGARAGEKSTAIRYKVDLSAKTIACQTASLPSSEASESATPLPRKASVSPAYNESVPPTECGGDSALMEASCIQYRLQGADAELNRIYREVLRRIDKNAEGLPEHARQELKKAQVEAQRHWVKFKETECRRVQEYLSWGHPDRGMRRR